MAVKIVTDEVSNMDEETAEKFGVSIIPYLITDADGKEVRISTDSNIYNPQEDIHNIRNFSTLDDYYNFLGKIKNKNEAPGTAAPDIERCRRFLQTTIEKEEGDICCIILASKLSRIYEYFKIAAHEVGKEFNRRIEVIDSKQAFDPLGLLAIEASRMAKLGKNLDEIVKHVEDTREKVFLIAPLDNLEYIRKSGRVPLHKSILTKVSDILGIVTILSIVDGLPGPICSVRRSRVRKRMLHEIERRIGHNEAIEVILGYSIKKQKNVMLEIGEELKEKFNVKDILHKQANKTVATHTGPNLYSATILRHGYNTINSKLLIQIFKKSEKKLRLYRKTVDRINIFPVNDSDTGKNMLKPMVGITTGINREDKITKVIDKIARKASNKGGGCSGNALSQYLLGISDYIKSHIPESQDLNPDILVRALKNGTENVYSSFIDPKEGTILSVMRVIGEKAEEALKVKKEISYILEKAYIAGVRELLNPKIQEVKILRDSEVSDSGGLGFIIFLQAWLDTLGISLSNEIQDINANLERDIKDQIESLKYKARYPGFCVECSIKCDIEREDIGDKLNSLPNKIDNNALIIRHGDGATYIHIHVSDKDLVDKVIHICKSYGYEIGEKTPTSLSQKRIDVFKYNFLKLLKKLKEIPFLFMYWFTPLPRIFFVRSEIRKTKKYRNISEERDHLKLVSKALEIKADEENTIIIVCNRKGEITYLNKSAKNFLNIEDGYLGEKVSKYLPKEISKIVEEKIITGSREECLFKDGDSTIKLRPIVEKRKNLGTLLEIKAEKD